MTASNDRVLRLGLIGHPVSHSLSPLMYRAAFRHFGLEGSYQLMDIRPEELPSVFGRLKDTFVGLNVTIPHKQNVVPLLDALTQQAADTRAVNTIGINNHKQAVGHNTDVGGFEAALAELVGVDTFNFDSVCIIGAGGAARSAFFALSRGAAKQVVIVARSQRQARHMVDEFRNTLDPSVQVILRTPGEPLNTTVPDLLVNCTPIGLGDDPVPQWLAALVKNCAQSSRTTFLFDMVYRRWTQTTTLVKQALDEGLIAVDGLQMLIQQAKLSFKFWTDIDVPADVLRDGIAEAES